MGDQSNDAPRGNNKLAETQAQVDEVVDIMRDNIESVMNRDEKLSELDDRADALQNGAAQFQQQAVKLKKKYWWKNMKMMLIIGGLVAIVLIILIVSLTTGGSNGNN